MNAGGRSRTAALALLAGVAVVASAAVVVPGALYWSKKGAVIRDARLKVLRSEDRAASHAALERTRSSWQAFVTTPRSGFSLAESDEAATAETIARIEGAFTALGGTASTVEAEASESGRDGVQGISVEVRGSVPRTQLGSLLGSLESTPPFVIVQRFDADTDAGDTLRIRLDGTVYRLSGGEP